MYSYGFSVKKKNVSISITSYDSKLIEEEYAKFAVEFLGIDMADVIAAKNNLATKQHASKEEVILEEEIPEEPIPETLQEKLAEEEIKTQKQKAKKAVKKLPGNFATLLAEKEKNTETNVIEKRDSELRNTYLQMQNLIKEKNLKDEIDYIISAAYCLTHYENALRFTEEQIVAKIAPFSSKKLDHNFILDAVAKNLIKVVPDFTGISDTIEYEISEYGEEYFINEL